jgi:tetratricopeptide (TPR) repeat protein
VILALLLGGSVALLQPAAPPWPTLALDTYSPAARSAIAAADKAAHAKPGDAAAAGNLGRVLHAWEQWEAARTAYTRAQALAPAAYEWHYLQGVVLQRLARPDLAVAAFREAVSRAPAYLPARLKLAEALLDAGNIEESRTRFTELTDPVCAPAVQFGLGTIAGREGRQAEAVEHLQRAIALFPEFGAAHYALARVYRALGQRDAAEAALSRHAQFGARWPAIEDPALAAVALAAVATLRDDPAALLQRGVKQAEAGEVAQAIQSHEAALALNPSFAQAHANLIVLYGRQRNWTKAEEHYRAVVTLAVNVADAHYDYGVLLGLQEQWAAAAAAYRKALDLNPQHAQARNNLGQVLEREGKLQEAASEYRLAVESQPALRIARFNLGRMLIAQGQSEAAIAELVKLTEPRDAEAPRYLFALATAHVRAGHRDAAIKWAGDAKALAEHFGDTALAAAIERDLARIR